MVVDGIQVEYPRYVFPPRILRGSYGHCYRQSIGRAFDRALNEFHPDIVYATWAYPDGWAAVKLARKANLPVVVKVHGSDIHLLDKHPARKRRTREALCQADGVIAVSEDLARQVVGLGIDSGRVYVVSNGVDSDLFSPSSRGEARRRLNLSDDRPIIVFVGNLVPVKGVDVLVRACKIFSEEKMDFSCYLIGRGPLQKSLEHQIQSCGLQGKIQCLGSKPHKELPDWYRAANLVVLPSHSEGLPNVLLEAVACGTRFVASDVGGIREIAIGDRGKLVPPGDAAALAQAIQSMLCDSTQQSSHLPAISRSFAESARDLARLLERTIASHHSPMPRVSQICPTR